MVADMVLNVPALDLMLTAIDPIRALDNKIVDQMLDEAWHLNGFAMDLSPTGGT